LTLNQKEVEVESGIKLMSRMFSEINEYL
jgi:hypothetical protein